MKPETPLASLRGVVSWYFTKVYGVTEGPGVLPFYVDPKSVGRFAVDPNALAAGASPALFKLFVACSMYQARRDVVIMRQQRGMSAATVATLASPRRIRQLVAETPCDHLASADAFDEGCDVKKVDGLVDCRTHPALPCPVKLATTALNRMGDSGKLPVSAWLRHWKGRGLPRLLAEVVEAEPDPTRRAELLVDSLARVHRVGRKLATMFVSAVSTPALAPGLTPWFPAVDGHALIVVDTHAARAVDALRPNGAPATYEARAQWLKRQAARIDLQEFRPDVPSYAPRLVQQALYAFGSRSNRSAAGDPCAGRDRPCEGCVPKLCPYGGR
jgi:hypothetical protein